MNLIIGSTGQLGSAIADVIPAKNRICTSRYPINDQIYFDLSMKLSHLIETLPVKIERIILCAAESDVSICEANPTASYLANVSNCISLIEESKEHDIPITLFSSEYVFNGLDPTPYTELCPSSPVNVYGTQKALLESFSLSQSHETLIFRISKLASYGDRRSFLARMLNTISDSDVYYAAVDQFFTPITTLDAARLVYTAGSMGISGLYNLCGRDSISRYELALHIKKAYCYSCDIVPVCLKEIYVPYTIPPNLTMSCAKMCTDFAFNPMHLDSYLSDATI